MIPRGIRNRNPGNIEKSNTPWRGKIPGDDPRFETFDTDHNGIRALAKNILAKRGRASTIRQLIEIWAPPTENDTEAYVRMVVAHTGIPADKKIDLADAEILHDLTIAIIQHENGQQPYPAKVIDAAVADALGVQQPDPFTLHEQPAKVNESAPPKLNQRKAGMDPLTLISVFGPLIGQLIPQVSKVFGGGERAQANVAVAQTVLDAVVKASGQPNVQGAVEAMQADPALTKSVTAAVVTDPEIVGLLEIGGGIKAARESDAAATQAAKSFLWSPTFWISLTLLAMPFMLLVDVFYVHFDAKYYSENIRTQIVTAVLLIVSMVGAFYLGSSQGSQKKDEAMAAKANQ